MEMQKQPEKTPHIVDALGNSECPLNPTGKWIVRYSGRHDGPMVYIEHRSEGKDRLVREDRIWWKYPEVDFVNERMKSLNDTMVEMEEKLGSVQSEIADLRVRMKNAASGGWNDEQIIDGQTWHSRDEATPNGFIWASDGINVWLIMGRGAPIEAGAVAVKMWCDAFIPAPPLVEV